MSTTPAGQSIVLQERVTLLDALLGGIQVYRNGCNFRLRFHRDGSVWLEFGCYCLVNLCSDKEELLRAYIDGDGPRGSGGPVRLPLTEHGRVELLKLNDHCARCGGHMHELPEAPPMTTPPTTQTADDRPLYGHHDADYEEYGEWFARHMDRMTAEQLDGKAEIAWELAYRDTKIDNLRAALERIALNSSGLVRRCATQALEGLHE